jgi:hypothetical protein
MHRPCAALLGVALSLVAAPARGQHQDHTPATDSSAVGGHEMWSAELGGGWRVLGMAQAFPILTFGAPGEDGSALNETAVYLTQPAIMANVESPGSRLTLRTTLNFEGLTQRDGELTFGGWGEGFIDRRHPHTLLHELMASANFQDVVGGEASVSVGRGFAPFGTDDPMARPGLKYPTNHHLSQILERWTVNGIFLRSGWSVEAALFGGSEPDGPYDLTNIESFGNSWSARLAKRWGPGSGPTAAWEASASYGNVVEEHDAEETATHLWNVAVRHERLYDFAHVYALMEFSRSEPEHTDGFFSFLAEAQAEFDVHRPYFRFEYATRPEYPRDGAPGTADFFRYDHDAHPLGATRWAIANVGYNLVATRGPVGIIPFVNVQHHRVALERGVAGLEPAALFGTDTFWSVSFGMRVFFGGGPMRMGAYGVLDPMTSMNRMMASPASAHE